MHQLDQGAGPTGWMNNPACLGDLTARRTAFRAASHQTAEIHAPGRRAAS
ncbi:MAG: hypothetical protein AAFY38_16210 [Pseudomonadota bacterium]